MRVTTLKASTDRLGGLLAYYAGLAEDRTRGPAPGLGPVDYYLDPDEPAGRWRGGGLGALGLSGDVEGEDLRAFSRDAIRRAAGPSAGDSATRRLGGSMRRSPPRSRCRSCGR